MKKLLAIASFVFLLSVPQAAHAIPLVIDSGWQSFGFGAVESSWGTDYQFTLLGTGSLKVTDAFLSGDQFDVLNSGSSIGLTSVPGSTGDQIGSNYDAAFADSRWSSREYILSPGSYDISGIVVLSPFQGGGAAIRLDTGNPQADAVPEPATMVLLGSGLLSTVALRKRLA